MAEKIKLYFHAIIITTVFVNIYMSKPTAGNRLVLCNPGLERGIKTLPALLPLILQTR